MSANKFKRCKTCNGTGVVGVQLVYLGSASKDAAPTRKLLVCGDCGTYAQRMKTGK